ncbi:hypothetical protein [Streptomyces sp. NL15-2K]|uniref:hypothetical protein n=1 Tax=Streptomyces sp. NL15-2K TaxID=376149 RepID=UPI000F5625E0|nr:MULTISPECIES: hypothetical protein [Actinomycetes]WKX10394.1 hypothetical protein Q4V64_23950 [Kutzneria buriramensis]GCB48099.1 hypothetical protein SNL152K_5422 [Streptomyces sp. NL15-2K]
MTTQSDPLEPGSLLYDPTTSKVGEYQDKSGPYALLRPIGGGREWQADPATLRPATPQERLRAELRAANTRTRTVGASVPPDPDDLCRPPLPLPGCAVCAELAGRREAARAVFDRSAETDANVLLRQHQRKEHRS